MTYEIGETVGIWTVLGRKKSKHGPRYIVKCNRCGFIHDNKNPDKMKNTPKRCNHMRNKWYSQRLARCYHDMIKRCHNEKNQHYYYYGGRGIKVCKEWRENKLAFNEWAIHNGYKDGLTIDRIDNDGNYCPENCRWVTKHFNATHKRCNHHLTYGDETMTPYEWSMKLGVSKHLFYKKCLKQPESEVEKFLADIIEGRKKYIKPIRHKRDISINGVSKPLSEWANLMGWKTRKLSDHFTCVGKKKCKKTIKKVLRERGILVIELLDDD